MRTAYLYPGQGAQSPGFLQPLFEKDAARSVLDEAADVLGMPLQRLDSEASLASTAAVQIGILVAGVAYTRLLAARGVHPDAVAGLSVGAFTAAVASGALSFADALRLVQLRGEAMASAYGGAGFGMLAIVGLRQTGAQALIDAIASPTVPLYLASVNASAQMVVAGSEGALAAATQAAQRMGARSQRLSVSVPSHCALLEGVSVRLRAAMRGIRVTQPRVPYISNHRARALIDGRQIAEDLIVNVSRTVHWHQSVTLLYELGTRLFIEAPPGHALSELVKNEFPQAQVVAGADVELDSVVRIAGQVPHDGP